MSFDPEDAHIRLAAALMAGEQPPQGEVFTSAPGLRVGQSRHAEYLVTVHDEDGAPLDIIQPTGFSSVTHLADYLRHLNPQKKAPTGRGWE